MFGIVPKNPINRSDFETGRLARLFGLPVRACPFRNVVAARYWRLGWYEADYMLTDERVMITL